MFDSMKKGFGWSFGFLFGIIAMNIVTGKYLEKHPMIPDPDKEETEKF